MKYLIAILILAGCSSPEQFATAPVENFHGQTITFVKADILHGWLTEHRNVRIVTMTGWNASDGNGGGFIVVYETPKVQVEK